MSDEKMEQEQNSTAIPELSGTPFGAGSSEPETPEPKVEERKAEPEAEEPTMEAAMAAMGLPSPRQTVITPANQAIRFSFMSFLLKNRYQGSGFGITGKRQSFAGLFVDSARCRRHGRG